jgi:hypothetical protein
MTVGHNVSRRTVLGMIASQLANASIGEALAASAGGKQPNVVFVLVDDVGYGDFACNGNPVIKTPNLDKLHDESVRFREFHVSPTCSPTRAALMTGRYSNATGVWHTIHGRSILGPDNAPYTNPKPNRETTPGIAIAATKAQIMIRDVDLTKPVPAEAKFVEFVLDLPKGPAELRTAFYDAVMNERGAYYVYVERV